MGIVDGFSFSGRFQFSFFFCYYCGKLKESIFVLLHS